MKVATNRDETRPKVRLYHGSNVEVKKPSLMMGRKNTGPLSNLIGQRRAGRSFLFLRSTKRF